jgi:3-methylfumaryl-CoA hydratase
VQVKQGRTGALCFVTVQHNILVGGEIRIAEQQDIVYRADTSPGGRKLVEPAPTSADATEEVRPDPTLLFRYSAVTFNGHRIHYDRDYAKQVEGYGGLVVHGPLIATLLIDLAVRGTPSGRIREFAFRAVAPIVDTETFTISRERKEKELHLWAANNAGQLSMTASAIEAD